MKRSPLTITVAAILIVIVGLMLFFFQVRKSEVAVVTHFGKVDRVQVEPGAYLCWPPPIENVYKLDQRIQNFESSFEETKLPDQNVLLLQVYVGWQISDPKAFFPKFPGGSVPEAEKTLDGLVRSAKNEVAGQHPFPDFISADEKQMKFTQIENEILAKVQKQVQSLNYGMDVKFIQIKKIGLPDSVTENVFSRMQSDRQVHISRIQSEGDAEASKIRAAANSAAATNLANADAMAMQIRGDGIAEQLKSLSVLEQNPELANFNLKLATLEQMLTNRTTLILDQNTSPMDLLQNNYGAQPKSGESTHK